MRHAAPDTRPGAWLRRAPFHMLVVLACVWCRAQPAEAHPTPGSVAYVDFTVDGAQIEQDVPIEELERAMKRTLTEAPEPTEDIVARHRELLLAYAAQHLKASTEKGGAPWDVRVLSVRGHESEDGPRALFHFALRAPEGEAEASVRLDDDLVAHEVVSHYTRIFVRSDWSRGFSPSEPQLVGTIHAHRQHVTVTRDGSFWQGLSSVVSLGIEHITTGTDHLLFLFALLLVAPLRPVQGRWQAREDGKKTLLALAKVVSAFTLGHSLTLAARALGSVELSVVLVESGIALSVLVTALHALRPMFGQREATVAAAFGLLHGLGLAGALGDRDLGTAQALWSLLGFNLGIELAQLALLCVVVPWLLLLSSTRFYAPFRLAGASVTLVLACGWLVERTLDLPNPTEPLVTWLEARPVALLMALALGALAARAVEKRTAPSGLTPSLRTADSCK